MKKIVLSALAVLTLGSVAASAGSLKFYVDEQGQVFTTAAEGRTLLQSKETPVYAKASKLKISGVHYLGYNLISTNEVKAIADGGPKDATVTGNFEMRRNYLQVKAYLFDDPKSFLRVTLDSTYTNATADEGGHADVYVKYAYLFVNDVLPFTGVEFGMVHRPWIDYEEHQGWWYRSISKVFVEASESAHLTNSADLGFNFKTKTEYVTTELGLFNGEGYHGTNDNSGANGEHIGTGNSLEWRTTLATYGNGDTKRKALKDIYFDMSFFGQYNMKNSHNADAAGNMYSYLFYGFHGVYNTPDFLISAQYVKAENDYEQTSEWNGKGFSVNATYRLGKKHQYEVLGRYDTWTSENQSTDVEQKTRNFIYGVAWKQNKNVKWLLTGQTYKADDYRNYKGSNVQNWNSAMLTAEVHW